MTAYELIEMHNSKHPESKLFSRDTLDFFGERIYEMRVLKKTEMHAFCKGDEERECYVLSARQHNAPNGGCTAYHYLAVDDLEHMGTECVWKK